ncbi:putative serine aminopeptidase, S33, alpha/Beta hydrolase [Lupinus albus]|uniref:Putative serine aminopeptidase, S33, alpha/Beta hydrolase n=1 Tax=Lupinus albus TaxID=3870 RepID=A0A6A4P3K5_LUPAL|nr:putative serine aminopeptidase, S33, alpha/Beta hydrolase [Lupinus albus]
MIEQFINFVIRPPRAEYIPDQYLWEKQFTLAGKIYQRQDLELKNARGHTLQCSHYLPSPLPEDTSLPCVIYCHGNSGCRVDANEAAVLLLPSNITVFTLDFSGSGLSDGDHVSLGWHEKDDLKMVVSHLRSNKQVSRIGLWGRSMGAVTSLLYGAEDPFIAGMVLDSAFSNLYVLMMELADLNNIRLPKFTVKMAVHYMRRVIEKKAKFDIMDLNCLQVAPKTFIPVLFGHANDDQFVQPHHTDLISKSYAGDKNIIKFNGDHNSSRPQSFYDSVSIFFYNALRPPHISKSRKLEKYYSLGSSRIGSDESLLYEIFASLQSATTGAASSSSALPSISTKPSVSKLLPIVAPVTPAESVIKGDTMYGYNEPAYSKDEPNGLTEECYSCASSTRENWDRCSSLALSDEESFPDFMGDDNNSEVFETPLGSMREQLSDPKEDMKNQKKQAKKVKSDRFERLESFSRRLRHCLLKGSAHRRHKSLS